HLLWESLFQKLIGADARAALGNEAHIVVLAARVPARRQHRQAEADQQPDQACGPGIGGGQSTETVKHCPVYPPCPLHPISPKLEDKGGEKPKAWFDSLIIGGGVLWTVGKMPQRLKKRAR